MSSIVITKSNGKNVIKAVDRGQQNYSSGIRSAVYGLWRGTYNVLDFLDLMMFTVESGLRHAWYEGARECNIFPADFTTEENVALRAFVNNQFAFLDDFADAIEMNSRANGGKLGPLYTRAALWINRYGEAKAQAKQMACGDQKLKWVWNPLKEHCSDCERLNGRVYRASVWQAQGIRPRMSGLECGGWQCGCDFVVTDEPVTRGRPPSIT